MMDAKTHRRTSSAQATKINEDEELTMHPEGYVPPPPERNRVRWSTGSAWNRRASAATASHHLKEQLEILEGPSDVDDLMGLSMDKNALAEHLKNIKATSPNIASSPFYPSVPVPAEPEVGRFSDIDQVFQMAEVDPLNTSNGSTRGTTSRKNSMGRKSSIFGRQSQVKDQEALPRSSVRKSGSFSHKRLSLFGSNREDMTKSPSISSPISPGLADAETVQSSREFRVDFAQPSDVTDVDELFLIGLTDAKANAIADPPVGMAADVDDLFLLADTVAHSLNASGHQSPSDRPKPHAPERSNSHTSVLMAMFSPKAARRRAETLGAKLSHPKLSSMHEMSVDVRPDFAELLQLGEKGGIQLVEFSRGVTGTNNAIQDVDRLISMAESSKLNQSASSLRK